VAYRLTSRSPSEATRSSVFCLERFLRSRRLRELGGSGGEATAFLPGGGVFSA
jgi:hypothetical protein